jgi:hypothetical protein
MSWAIEKTDLRPWTMDDSFIGEGVIFAKFPLPIPGSLSPREARGRIKREVGHDGRSSFAEKTSGLSP